MRPARRSGVAEKRQRHRNSQCSAPSVTVRHSAREVSLRGILLWCWDCRDKTAFSPRLMGHFAVAADFRF